MGKLLVFGSVLAIGLATAGCSSTPKRPAEFMMPTNEFTWERGERLQKAGAAMEVQGERLEKEGDRLRDQADAIQKQGERMVEDAKVLRQEADNVASQGTALRERGREASDLGLDAKEAVHRLEKAERLRREGEALRESSQER